MTSSPLKVMKKICSICKNQVLTIQGEYHFVDSYWINPEKEHEIPPSGYLHAKCLSHTKWGQFWFERQKNQYMNNPNYQSIDLKDEGILFKSHRKGIESLFINPNGVAIELVFPWKDSNNWIMNSSY